jgi:predicted RNA-binding Zn ribbon-like protein
MTYPVPPQVRDHPSAETFKCPGGELALDYCNTGQGMRGTRGIEWFKSYGELLAWLEATSAVNRKQAAALHARAEHSPHEAQKVFVRALALREAIARVLIAKTEGKASAAEDLRLIEREHAHSAPCGRLEPTDGGFRWTIDAEAQALDSILRPLLESTVSLMTSERMKRLRRCGSPTCYWLFLDQTKNSSRRWCEMKSCGNVMKVRRHRERQRAA